MSNRLRPLVPCYHAVSDGWDDALAVRPDAFRRRVQSVLARGYRPVRAAEAAAGHGRLFHVTFDDTFEAWPRFCQISSGSECPPRCSHCPGFVGARRLRHPRACSTATRRLGAPRFRWAGRAPRSRRAGFEVGSHTVTHPRLTKLDDHELRRELRESREQLEDELGVPCRFVSYPYGEQDERVRARRVSAATTPRSRCRGSKFRPTCTRCRVGIWREDGLRRVSLKTSAVGRRLLLDLLDIRSSPSSAAGPPDALARRPGGVISQPPQRARRAVC